MREVVVGTRLRRRKTGDVYVVTQVFGDACHAILEGPSINLAIKTILRDWILIGRYEIL